MKRLSCCALLLLSLSAHANLALTIVARETNRTPKGVQVLEPVKDRLRTLHVVLGTDFIRADDGATITVYDFAKRRWYVSDIAAGTLEDRSLFVVAGSRSVELENRAYLSDVMKELKGTAQEFMALPFAEHELSMRYGSDTATIDRTVKGGEVRHLWKRQELMAWATESLPASAAEREQFVRFIRYEFGGHPAILTDLSKSDGIPKRLRISEPKWGRTTQLEISDASRSPDAPFAALRGIPVAGDDPMSKLIATARASTAESRAAAAATLIIEASKAAKDKPLDAMLGYFEYTLMTGNDLPPAFFEQRDAIVANADVASLLEANRPSNADEAKVALATHTRLQSIAPAKAHVIAIFRGDVETNLGDMDAAITDFETALTSNPLVAGVWIDLGHAFHRSYDSAQAWRCFELARFLAPNHGLIATVNELEAKLLRENPEYF